MSFIEKKYLAAAKNILIRALSSVADNSINRQLTQLVNIGEVKGKRIILTQKDRIQLEKYFDHHLGQPIRHLSLDTADRLIAAKQSNEEKFARGSVFESLLNIARHQKPLPIIEQLAMFTPPGMVISTPLHHLDFEAITQIIVTENGQLLTHWSELIPCLPLHLQHALILYRGHGSNQNLLKTVLEQTPSHCEIVLFYDFDPAGLAMALELTRQHLNEATRNVSLLLPASLIENDLGTPVTPLSPINLIFESLISLSKPEIFHAQHTQLSWLENQFADMDKTDPVNKLAGMIGFMRQHQIAITQEHMVAHNMPLGIMSLSMHETTN